MNIVLFSLDTTRADHLSCYGYPRLTSPHLDRLAGQGVLFEQCYSQFIPTDPGHTTMLSGCDIFRHQVVAQGSPKVTPGSETPWLSEILQSHGYHTAAVDSLGRWYARGYDVYRTYGWERDRNAREVTEMALDVLEEAAGQSKPFFLFLHYWDPHTPYAPPEPFARMFYSRHRDEEDPTNTSMDRVWGQYEALNEYFGGWLGGFGRVRDADYVDALYDAEIAHMDAALTEFFTRLDELGLADDTLVVLTADHGEELHEHDQCWWDHHGLYETNTHVPLIMRCPARLPAGRRVRGFVGLQDVAPTILEMADLGAEAQALCMDGRSVVPLAGSRSRAGVRQAMYLAECTWMSKFGWRTTDWKLIVALDDPFGLPSVELYDMRADPAETRNLAEEHPEVVAGLLAQAKAWQRRRMRATRRPDPQSYQEITLRHIGKR
ncbi:MAG: sulfatase family protein [Anaerolineae bacterium]